ncbi:MAG: hypothetical protein HPY74_20655 [Firmicutes bacterium]|nr:hypothetical protein [Bacillota bacterium]
MNKRNLGILVGIAVLLVIVVFAKGIFKGDPKQISDSNADLKTQYEYIKSCNKPSIIVFSYDADCCPGTKQFFDEYNSKVKKLIKDYEGKFEGLFINIGVLTTDDQKLLEEIAKDNGASILPSFVIRDANGKPQKLVEGPFDEKEVRKFMDGMVK